MFQVVLKSLQIEGERIVLATDIRSREFAEQSRKNWRNVLGGKRWITIAGLASTPSITSLLTIERVACWTSVRCTIMEKVMAKSQSRAARWANAASRALQALSDLREVQGEYEEWRDNLPENLASSPLGEKLAEVCDLDIESAMTTVEEAENVELPRGFGRD